MKNLYRLYRRHGGVFYIEVIATGRQESLKTRDQTTAEKLLNAKNAAADQPLLNLALARVHLAAHDPRMMTRTWQRAMDEFCTHGRTSTQERSVRAFICPAFDAIRNQTILESTAEDFLKLMKGRGPALTHYLRRLHNLALNLGWLPWPVLHKAAWPKPQHVSKRALTEKEYRAIIKAERNEERRRYYELLWEIGAAQMDAAQITADNIDWLSMTLIFHRQKLRDGSEPCVLRIGPTLAKILKALPQSGPLFPGLIKTGSKERAAEFRRRCRVLGIKGVTLHSFRYSWAERACRSGYPERFAQAALGHASKAVHRAYSRGAKVLCPSLEDYEAPTDGVVVPFTPKKITTIEAVGSGVKT
jgi:integrase